MIPGNSSLWDSVEKILNGMNGAVCNSRRGVLCDRLINPSALCAWILIIASFGLCHGNAADADLDKLKAQLQAEIDAIKNNYETRIRELEKRIQTLESDNAKLKNPAPAAAPASAEEIDALKKRVAEVESVAKAPSPEAQEAMNRAKANAEAIQSIQQKLHESATETREIYRDDGGWPFNLTNLYELPRPLEFHGYLRSGLGLNGDGGKMEAFKAPGAGAKYRLGNEADTYGEIGFTHNWLRADDPLKAPYVRTEVMMSYSTAQNFSYESLNNQNQGNDVALRQAYVEAGNVFQSAPDIRFWGGQRYYQRHDIHINDFYYLDMSGYGAGVQDVPAGEFGKVALAWLGGSVDNYVTDNGHVAKQNIDLRLYDVKVPFGKLKVWLNYANTRGGDVRNIANPDGSKLTLDSSGGWAVGVIHRTEDEKLWGGYNEFSLQYGTGAAYNFASTLDTSGPDLGDASRFRVTDQLTIQPVKHFSMQLVGLYEDTTFGGPNSRNHWASAGVRPIVHLTDRFSLAFEAGFDWAKSEPMGTEGTLWKFTFAPQISRGGRFFSRPVIRPFITYALWSDDFRGLIGGTPYENATDGLSYGVQVEAWW